MNIVRSLVLASLLFSSAAAGQWIVQPSPTTKDLFEVHFLDSLLGYVVGQDGVVLRTTDGGSRWVNVSSNFYPEYANMVTFLDTPYVGRGWIVSDGGAILQSTNFGLSWSYDDVYAETENFYDMAAIQQGDSVRLFAVGGASTSSHYGIVSSSGDGSWHSILSGHKNCLSGITFKNPTHGFVVGWGGSMFKTTDGGDTWEYANSGTDTNLCSIRFFNNNIGVLVGDKGMIRKTTDGGDTWRVVRSGGDIVFLSVVVMGDSVAYAVGSNTTLLVSTDQGNTWRQDTVAGPTGRGMSGIYFIDGRSGWAVGSKGLILHTSHGLGKTGSKQ